MSQIVPTDSPSIFDALNTLVVNQAAQAIIRPQNPPPGIAGFLADIVEDDGSELESDIPDYYVEDNTPAQDIIALRPEVVTVSFSVAELVRIIPSVPAVGTPQNPLQLIQGYLPTQSPGAAAVLAQAQANIAKNGGAIASAQTFYGYYKAQSPQSPNQTRQSQAYGFFYQLWKGRERFSVETPWGIFTNMAILSLSARQGPESKSVTQFEITFKKIRTVSSAVAVPGLLAGRAANQYAPTVQNGTIGQTPVPAPSIPTYAASLNPK